MTIKKKPITNANDFIENAEADKGKTSKRDNGTKVKRKKVLSFYMTEEMYIDWEIYKLEQLKKGEKITFQGKIEKYISNLIKK